MKKNKILVIIPTKDRLDDFKVFAKSWMDTTEGKSDVLVGIDVGDTTYDEMKSYPFIFEEVTPKPFLYILNELATKYASEYKYIAFMEDDCNFNTKWESTFIQALEQIGDYGIVWGNDLLNKDYIVGLPFMDSKIIEVLGYMTPPEIKYLWADHFWKHLGEALGTLHYFPDVIVEHRHYSTGKRTKDELSLEVDTKGQEDYLGYNQHYKPHRFGGDVQKLINARS
jgi:hypothetical protein